MYSGLDSVIASYLWSSRAHTRWHKVVRSRIRLHLHRRFLHSSVPSAGNSYRTGSIDGCLATPSIPSTFFRLSAATGVSPPRHMRKSTWRGDPFLGNSRPGRLYCRGEVQHAWEYESRFPIFLRWSTICQQVYKLFASFPKDN